MSFISHIKEAFAEKNYVKWPRKKTVINSTIAIIIISIIIAAYIGALDILFSKFIKYIVDINNQ